MKAILIQSFVIIQVFSACKTVRDSSDLRDASTASWVEVDDKERIHDHEFRMRTTSCRIDETSWRLKGAIWEAKGNQPFKSFADFAEGKAKELDLNEALSFYRSFYDHTFGTCRASDYDILRADIGATLKGFYLKLPNAKLYRLEMKDTVAFAVHHRSEKGREKSEVYLLIQNKPEPEVGPEKVKLVTGVFLRAEGGFVAGYINQTHKQDQYKAYAIRGPASVLESYEDLEAMRKCLENTSNVVSAEAHFKELDYGIPRYGFKNIKCKKVGKEIRSRYESISQRAYDEIRERDCQGERSC